MTRAVSPPLTALLLAVGWLLAAPTAQAAVSATLTGGFYTYNPPPPAAPVASQPYVQGKVTMSGGTGWKAVSWSVRIERITAGQPRFLVWEESAGATVSTNGFSHMVDTGRCHVVEPPQAGDEYEMVYSVSFVPAGGG